MSAAEVILAVDVGTTATKAAAVTKAGRIMALGSSSHPTVDPRPGWVEQHPEEWWRSTCEAVEYVRGEIEDARPAGLVITGQMQDVVPMAADGRVVRPAILYSDTRSADENSVLEQQLGADRWAGLTGNVQDPSNIAAKWLWLQNHEPDVQRQIQTLLLGAHSYAVWRACGARVCDPTTASTTGLYDITEGVWSRDVALAASLQLECLPDLVSPTAVVGTLSPGAADALGLPAGLPVIHAPGDAATTTLGVGAGRPGVRYVYLGTSGWVAGSVARLVRQPSAALYTLRHPVNDWSLRIGPMLSVGSCVEWAARTLLDGDVAGIDAAVVSTPPGPSPVMFLPYLAGERAPYRDADARGAFVGLSHATTPAELSRAVLEGVSYALRSIADVLDSAGPDDTVLVCGGGARSDVWCQILADVFGRDVVRTSFDQAGVLGAAMVAAEALGWEDLRSNSWPAQGGRQRFGARRATGYDAGYEIFNGLYPALQSTFRQMARQSGRSAGAQPSNSSRT